MRSIQEITREPDPFRRELFKLGFEEIYERPCENEIILIDREEKKMAIMDLCEWKGFVSSIRDIQVGFLWNVGMIGKISQNDRDRVREFVQEHTKICNQMEPKR